MVNTLWFQINDDSVLPLIPPVIADFYLAIDEQLSDQALSPTGHTIKLYNQEDVEPRSPVEELTFGLTGLSAATALPAEVALCSSFQGDPVSGQNQQQRRGRIYISGWINSANGSGGRPSQATRILLGNATAQLSNDLQAIGSGLTQVVWVVYSRTADENAQITNGWVDDAWDTQRRRGVKPSTRTTWS